MYLKNSLIEDVNKIGACSNFRILRLYMNSIKKQFPIQYFK